MIRQSVVQEGLAPTLMVRMNVPVLLDMRVEVLLLPAQTLMNAQMIQPYVEMVHQHVQILMVLIPALVLLVIQMEVSLLLLAQKLMSVLSPLVYAG